MTSQTADERGREVLRDCIERRQSPDIMVHALSMYGLAIVDCSELERLIEEWRLLLEYRDVVDSMDCIAPEGYGYESATLEDDQACRARLRAARAAVDGIEGEAG